MWQSLPFKRAPADATGRCNGSAEHFRRCLEAERLARPLPSGVVSRVWVVAIAPAVALYLTTDRGRAATDLCGDQTDRLVDRQPKRNLFSLSERQHEP